MIAVAVGLVLVAVAIAISARWRLGISRELAVAAVRALLQLLAVALVIQAIFEHLGAASVFVLGMLGIAAWTASRRMSSVPRALAVSLASIGAAAGVTLTVLFAVGAFPLTPRYVIPTAGIIIGGAMSCVSLVGIRLADDLADKRGDIEARLALGVSVAEAVRPWARRSVVTSLVPALDQTKNVGLVSLPGAFVGMLLGGASPMEAAQVQLTVLLALLGTEALAAVIAAAYITGLVTLPGERLRRLA
ncbi:ABC transporter permease [Egicoccus sp. AB-alg6-2]|uniref:ABC transporter permease n=1 Tax=Egicoccus sp. AB-alg6-2 TaxID=3242692 RepID=UPI00359E9127